MNVWNRIYIILFLLEILINLHTPKMYWNFFRVKNLILSFNFYFKLNINRIQPKFNNWLYDFFYYNKKMFVAMLLYILYTNIGVEIRHVCISSTVQLFVFHCNFLWIFYNAKQVYYCAFDVHPNIWRSRGVKSSCNKRRQALTI